MRFLQSVLTVIKCIPNPIPTWSSLVMFITLLGSCGTLAILSTSFQGNMPKWFDANHTRGVKPWVCLRYYPSQREYYHATYLTLIARVRVVDISTRSSAGPWHMAQFDPQKRTGSTQFLTKKKSLFEEQLRETFKSEVRIRGNLFWSPDRKCRKSASTAERGVPRTALLSKTVTNFFLRCDSLAKD